MFKIKDRSAAFGMAIILTSVIIQPVAGWGELTHEAIASQLTGVPFQVTSYPGYTKGGSVGPDMFFFLPGKEYYSYWAHYDRTADLPRAMLDLSTTDREKAYAYGWLSHCASDIKGHVNYVNVKVAGSTDPSLHTDVEIGVDANLVGVTGSTFYVPYGLIQKGYRNIYGNAPWQITIASAAQSQQAAIYVEKAAILAGVYNDLKGRYSDYGSVYAESIDYSRTVINDPLRLPNANLDTGALLTSLLSPTAAVTSDMKKLKHDKVDADILDTADELLKNGAIEVPVHDDKINKVLYVGETVVKNKKLFDNAIEKMKTKKSKA